MHGLCKKRTCHTCNTCGLHNSGISCSSSVHICIFNFFHFFLHLGDIMIWEAGSSLEALRTGWGEPTAARALRLSSLWSHLKSIHMRRVIHKGRFAVLSFYPFHKTGLDPDLAWLKKRGPSGNRRCLSTAGTRRTLKCLGTFATAPCMVLYVFWLSTATVSSIPSTSK